MSYEFNQQERELIQAAMAQCTGLEWDVETFTYKSVDLTGTNCVPLYQTLSTLIGQKLNTPEIFDQATLSDLNSAKLWLDVAIGANSGVGMHSEFIRAFTNRGKGDRFIFGLFLV